MYQYFQEMAEKKEQEISSANNAEDKLVGTYAKLIDQFFQDDWEENEYTKEYK